MQTRASSLVLIVIMMSTPLLAQQVPPNNEPASRQDVLKLFDLLQVRDQTKMALENTQKQVKEMIRELFLKKLPDATPDQLSHMDSIVDDLFKNYPVEGILEDAVPIYQKHLTKADLDGVIEFYSSPLGKKLLREMPAMTAESMQACNIRIRQNMEDVMDKMEGKIEEMTKQQRKKHSSPVPRPPKS